MSERVHKIMIDWHEGKTQVMTSDRFSNTRLSILSPTKSTIQRLDMMAYSDNQYRITALIGPTSLLSGIFIRRKK